MAYVTQRVAVIYADHRSKQTSHQLKIILKYSGSLVQFCSSVVCVALRGKNVKLVNSVFPQLVIMAGESMFESAA